MRIYISFESMNRGYMMLGNHKFPKFLSSHNRFIPLVSLSLSSVYKRGNKSVIVYPAIEEDVGILSRFSLDNQRDLGILVKGLNLTTKDVIMPNTFLAGSTPAYEWYSLIRGYDLIHRDPYGITQLVKYVARKECIDDIKRIRDSNTMFYPLDYFAILVDQKFRERRHNYLWRNYNRIFKQVLAGHIEIIEGDIESLCYNRVPFIPDADRIAGVTGEIIEEINPTTYQYVDGDINLIDDTEVHVIDEDEEELVAFLRETDEFIGRPPVQTHLSFGEEEDIPF